MRHHPGIRKKIRPSQITQILVRLFALTWFLQGIVQFVAAFAIDRTQMSQLHLYLSGALELILAGATWCLAPPIGRLIAGPNDQEGIITGISFSQLLHAMFIGIGLFFCLSSIGGLLNNLYFFIVDKTAPQLAPQNSLYDLSRNLVTFAASLFVIFTAPAWVRKLLKNQAG